MTKKNVDDYLQEGMYGTRLPKDAERKQFLGTLRERIILALTVGEVMSDRGLEVLEKEMMQNPKAKLIMNGDVAYKYLKQEKEIANKHAIPYTTISNQEHETDIGAVLTYDYAIDKESIYLSDYLEDTESEIEEYDDSAEQKNEGFFDRIKNWFK